MSRSPLDVGLETAIFGVTDWLSVGALGRLICASGTVRAECAAQRAWSRLERQLRGADETGCSEGAERASAGRIRALLRQTALADAMQESRLHEIPRSNKIHSVNEVSFFVRASLDRRTLWEGQVPCTGHRPSWGARATLDFSEMWLRIHQNKSCPTLETFLKTPIVEYGEYLTDEQVVPMFRGFSITVIAVRADDRMCPLGCTRFVTCNGTIGEEEQTYIFEPVDFLPGHPTWNLELCLSTRHLAAGGEIVGCDLYFFEHSHGVISSDNFVGAVEENFDDTVEQFEDPLLSIYNALEWV